MRGGAVQRTIDFDALRELLGDVAEGPRERYQFTWPGKSDAIRQAQIPTTATLRPDEESSVNWDTTENLYIEGDNLEVLKLLQRGYHGKVKMIYIDPPYNTGHDFVYKDSFKDSIENYKEQAGLSGQSNADTSGRYHSDWLSMMYPRLKLARELLTNDGVIFISIDENEMHNLKKCCDEIFGEQNFINQINWVSNSTGRQISGVGAAKTWECVLLYAKNISFASSLTVDIDFAKATMPDMYKGFKREVFTDDIGEYVVGDTLWNHNRKFNEETRPNLVFSIFWNPESGDIKTGNIGDSYKGYKEILPHSNGDGKHLYHAWRWGREKIDNEKNDLIVKPLKSGDLEIYTRIREFDKTILKDTITNLSTGDNKLIGLFDGERIFDYPKPVEFLILLVKSISAQKGIFLDFFSGSATLPHAVIAANANDSSNRSFIAVQLPESLNATYPTIPDFAEERIRRAGAKIKAEIEEENKQLKLGEEPKPVPDIGFRVLKLDSSNFDRVEGGTLIDNLIKPGRTNDDIIFEMMLKWGLELSLPMEKTEVAGYPITSIACDELICCMDERLTVEVLEAIAALEPKRVFFLDSVLTDTIKLNAAQIFKRVGDKLGYEIELRTA